MSGYRKLDLDAEMCKLGVFPAHPGDDMPLDAEMSTMSREDASDIHVNARGEASNDSPGADAPEGQTHRDIPAHPDHAPSEMSRRSNSSDSLCSTTREDQQPEAPHPPQGDTAKLANVAKDMDAVRSISNLSKEESSRTHALEPDAVLTCQHSVSGDQK
jgi:hypothetical protein